MMLKPIVDKVLADGVSKFNVLELQVALKLLGFMPRNHIRQCDGFLGSTTKLAMYAFQAHQDMGRGVYDITNEINDCLLNPNWLKVPFVEHRDTENRRIIEFLGMESEEIIRRYDVPYPFLRLLLNRVTKLIHYDVEGFLFVKCDLGFNLPEEYCKRGWGIGWYVTKKHPPTHNNFRALNNPISNLSSFIRWVMKPQFIEGLDRCKHPKHSNLYMNDCNICRQSVTIRCGWKNLLKKLIYEGE